MEDVCVRCFNVEDGYGYQVMMDKLIEKGLSFQDADDITKDYFKKPKADRGNPLYYLQKYL